MSDQISIPEGNPNKNTKPGWEIRIEGQINCDNESAEEGKHASKVGNLSRELGSLFNSYHSEV